MDRRELLVGGANVLATLASGSLSTAGRSKTLTAGKSEGPNSMTTIKKITFKNKQIAMAGDLHLPSDFEPDRKYAAIVCVHPGSSVKEQTSGLYARKMAENGFVALAFDASYQGESGGEPRYLEEPASRVEDIRCAVDCLMTLNFVDEGRVGVLGVCAGGGFSVNAAMTEHRIKAVGTVVAINMGRARRAGDGSKDYAIKLLEKVGAQRTLEARGGVPLVTNWIPNSVEDAIKAGVKDVDLKESVEYYRTARAMHPNACNKLRYRSIATVIAFDAFHLVEQLLTQPIQIIIGDRIGGYGSYVEGQNLFNRVTSQKDLMVIKGASHNDLYDKPEYVNQAVEKLVAFYTENLPHADV